MTALSLLGRALAGYVGVLVLIRTLGRRPLSPSSPLDFVVATAIGSVLGSGLLRTTAPVWHILLVATALVSLQAGLALLSAKSPAFRRLVSGTPVLVVDQGKVLEGALLRTGLNADRLVQLLRERGAHRLADVEIAVIETDGELSIIKQAGAQPLTAAQAGKVAPPADLPRIVIADGKVRPDQLAALGKNESWLQQELHQRGVSRLDDVFLAQADPNGELTVDLKKDHQQVQQPTDRLALLAKMEKAQSDLRSFTLDTNNADAKQLYTRLAAHLEGIVRRVRPHLAPEATPSQRPAAQPSPRERGGEQTGRG